MPRIVLLVALALFAVASAQWVDSAFRVSTEDQLCTSDSDCTFVGSSCCFNSACSSYQAVNRSSLPKYQELLQAYVSANCTAVLCAQNICSPPLVKCLASSTNARSVCSIGGALPAKAFEAIAPADQACENARDCSFVGNTCCADSNCDYLAVNVTAKPKYVDLLATFTSQSCAAVMCLARACEAPQLDCVPTSRGGNVCAIKTCDTTVQCLRDPCEDAVCNADSTATCRANYCGGCNAEFFDANGVKVNCDVTDPCNGLPVVDCFRDPCEGATCSADPTATCRPNYCGGCNAEFFDSKGVKVDCNAAPGPCNRQPVANCIKDPCQGAVCPADLTATCRADYCGGCNALWYDSKGALVDCLAVTDPCPAGVPVVNCIRDPCQGVTCAADPAATCRSNYCGGCNAEFFDANGRKVDCGSAGPEPEPCPAGVPIVDCFAEPCSVSKCSLYPGAECRANYCGGCFAEYHVNGEWLRCGETPNPCTDGIQLANCLLNPCDTASCPAFPNAECEADYCGGCTAVFKVDGRKVDCGELEVPPPHTECPAGVPEVQCLADPCSVADCPAYPHADCKADYCGGCRAIFSVEGKLVNCDAGCLGLSCDQCLQKSHCKYCSGDYITQERLGDINDFGFCIAASSVTEKVCESNKGSLIAPGTTCPTKPTHPAADHAPIQAIIDASVSQVRDKFVIVITLVLNETSHDARALNIVKMFVELIGPGTPTDTDKTEVCEILKNALTRVDARVPEGILQCSLEEKVTVKRDTSYVAKLTYPSGSSVDNNGNSGQGVVVSMTVLAVAGALASL